MLKRIAVVNQWPKIPNAEKENIKRIQATCEALGVEVLVIDKLGCCLETGQEITSQDVDFVIHLHFETPKCYDAFSYVALWNPLAFYFDWGYSRTSRHLLTHDDFLSCSSMWADDHIKRLISRSTTHLPPTFELHHSLSETIESPKIHRRPKYFYCGINWEKINKAKGRFEPILKALDRVNMIAIYGPKKLHGVEVWKGFKNYVKEIPFDGKSTITEIAKCGIALVFSSDAHKQSALMSNRLFESAAAGAVIVADNNPFVKKFFGDSVLYINASQDNEVVIEQLKSHYQWIKNNPQQALELACRAQKIFLDQFDLKKELQHIIENHEQRKKLLFEKYCQTDSKQHVTVCHVVRDSSDLSRHLEHLFTSLDRQIYKNFSVVIYIDESMAIPELRKTAYPVNFIRRSLLSKPNMMTLGAILLECAESCSDNDLIHFSAGKVRFFSDHLASMVYQFTQNSNIKCTISDILLTHTDVHGDKLRELLPLADIQALKNYSTRFDIPFMINVKFISSSDACFVAYLDSLLPVYYFWKADQQEEHASYAVTLRSTCHIKKSDVLDPNLNVSQQIDIVRDKFSTAFNQSTDNIDLFNLYRQLGNYDKSLLSEQFLKYIPFNKNIRRLFVRIYRIIFRRRHFNEIDEDSFEKS